MGEVFVISGRSGAGKSTLLRALVDEDPSSFRFMTIVTTRKPKTSDVQHPTNASWSEYAYVSEHCFDFWHGRDDLIFSMEDKSLKCRFGLLASTVRNVIEFEGRVFANIPPAHFIHLDEVLGWYKRNPTGIFLDAPEDVLHRRMLGRGNTEDEARTNMRVGAQWPDMAAELGYRFVSNPDEADGVPRVAMANTKKLIGLG